MTTTVPLQIYSLTPHPSVEYWSVCKVEALFEIPFLDLVYKAAQVHRENFNPRAIQLSTLMSIKTGGCPEDCHYCPQDMQKVTEIIRAVKALGLETCGTFGMLEDGMAEDLKNAGLDYYNHNLDTAPEHYRHIIGTRGFDDRLNTLGKVRKAGLKVCCGGIIGMNENRKERAGLIASLANLDPQPESVPINQLVKVEGTPLADAEELDWTEFVRTIAVARITMPRSYVRLSAGRQGMSEEMQAMCFMAGANSIFYGDKLLVTGNPGEDGDQLLMAKLDLEPETEENRYVPMDS